MTEKEKLYNDILNGVRFAFDEIGDFEYSKDAPEEVKENIVKSFTYYMALKSEIVQQVVTGYLTEPNN